MTSQSTNPTQQNNRPLEELSKAGVAVWLDDLSRELVQSGSLAGLVHDRSVVGVTSNPTIFAAALSKGDRYTDQVPQLAADGADVDEAVFEMTTHDVREACDVLRPVYDAHDGQSTAGSPSRSTRVWRATRATTEARRASSGPPSTAPTCTSRSPRRSRASRRSRAAISEGISVNVTLIFSLDRYRAVMNAFLRAWSRPVRRASTCRASSPWRASSSPGWTPTSTSSWTPIGTDEAKGCAEGRPRQRPPRLPGLRGGLREPPLDGPGRRRRARAAAAVGLHRGQGPDLARHPLRRRAGRRRRRQHDAGRHAGGLRRPRRGHRRHGPRHLRGVRRGLRRTSSGSGISYEQVVTELETEGVDKFEKSWSSWATPCATSSTAPTALASGDE